MTSLGPLSDCRLLSLVTPHHCHTSANIAYIPESRGLPACRQRQASRGQEKRREDDQTSSLIVYVMQASSEPFYVSPDHSSQPEKSEMERN